MKHQTMRVVLAALTPSLVSAQPMWRVSPAPTLALGNEQSNEFIFSRAVSARLASGHIVVVDGSLNEVRVFGASGNFIATRSRRGRGPGEFEARNFAVTTVDDSVFVLEQPPGTAHVHVFTLDQGTERTALRGAPGAPAALNPWHRTESGHVLAAVGGLRLVKPLGAGQARVDSLRIGVYSTGAPHQWMSIGTVPSLEVFGYVTSDGGTGIVGSAFGSVLVTGVSRELFWIGNARTGAVQLVNTSGAVERTLRLPITPAAITRAAIETRRAAALENASSDAEQERVRAMYANRNLPKTLPHFTRFVGGPNGEMWVQVTEARETDSTQFLVVDALGAIKARVIVPRRLRVDQVGPDWILGVARDDLGRETVLRYALTRNVR